MCAPVSVVAVTVRCAIVALSFSCPALVMAQTSSASLPIESPSVAVMPPNVASRVYLPDLTAGHLVDTRVIVADGESLRYLATIPSGMIGLFAPNPVRGELNVATTYLSRGTRGTRTDVIEIYDAQNLDLKGEIELPPKRAQALDYASYFRPSSDGTVLFVQNITPASSVSVASAAGKRLLTEVETSGCAGIYPSPTTPLRFSTLCGDGTAVTITLDPAGRELTRLRSKPLFDAEKDPLFIADAQSDRGSIFISFNGMVHQVDFSGEVAQQVEPWSLLAASDVEAGWRPGGYQVLAFHRPSGQLYVAMHAKGKEGSHKQPADEIWQIDIAKRQRVGRVPGEHAVALGVSQTSHPYLFALDGNNGALIKFDASGPLKRAGSLPSPLVEAPTTMVMP